MNNNSFLKITLASLLGLIIAGTALTSGTWVTRTISPNLSAIDLWLGLRASLSSTEVLANTLRQQNIFNWLTVIIVSFVAQAFTTISILNWRKVAGWGVSLILWIITLSATGILLIGFHASVSGVYWLGLGCIVALAGETWVILNEIHPRRHDHSHEITYLASLWSGVLKKAKERNKPLSILSISTIPPVSFEEVQKLQIDLRGQDRIYQVQNGMFILLWDISPENTRIIANKLSNSIQGYSTRIVQIGYACYPGDGIEIHNLLAYSLQALKSAQVVGGSTIIPFSSPAQKNSYGVLAPWENLLEEAERNHIPIVTIYFQTKHPLSLSENYLIQKELRGRDMVTVFENGFYVFLWNTNPEGGQVVLSKLNQILSDAHIEHQSILALFPDDGKNMTELLSTLNQSDRSG